MENLKHELKELILGTMIPESEAFLEELHKELTNEVKNEESIEAIKDMESFLVELQNILTAIEQNKISNEEIEVVYGKIIALLDEHEE